MDSKMADEKHIMQLGELEEFHNEAYENEKIYKEKTKAWNYKSRVNGSSYLTPDSNFS